MPLSDDTKQRISIFTAGLQQAFKILMACLLAVFVPQSCRGTDGTVHLCSEEENFKDLTPFNVFVLVYNFTTLGSFIYFFVIEFMRENMLVKYFDIDAHKGDYAIQEEIKSYPKIQNSLTTWNRLYYKSTMALLFFLVTNFLVSAILVLRFFYLDFRTITTLLTNTLLVVDKLSVASAVAKQSYVEHLPVSFYQKKHISLNVIDADYKGTMPTIQTDPVKPEDVVIESNSIKVATLGVSILQSVTSNTLDVETKVKEMSYDVEKQIQEQVNETVQQVTQKVNETTERVEQQVNETAQEIEKQVNDANQRVEQQVNQTVEQVTEQINETAQRVEENVNEAAQNVEEHVTQQVSRAMEEIESVNESMKEIIALAQELQEEWKEQEKSKKK